MFFILKYRSDKRLVTDNRTSLSFRSVGDIENPFCNVDASTAGYWGYNEFCEKMLNERPQWTFVRVGQPARVVFHKLLTIKITPVIH
jgi:hypothetical protein